MPEPDFLDDVREAYNAVADDYDALLKDDLDARPVDRAVLAAFAGFLDDGAPVADVGCGPGRVTAHLRELGLDAFGIDLSPGMLEVARRNHPDLRFESGSMLDLDLHDGSLAGITAWYSIIHLPLEHLPQAFLEFRRVLRDGGQVLLAFPVGNESVHVDHAYGHDVSVEAHRLAPDRVSNLLREAGLTVHALLVRGPEDDEERPQAFLLARR